MATLKKQISLLEEELKLNKQVDDARYILGEYETIRDSLSKVDISIRNILDHYQILQSLPEDAPVKIVFSEEMKETLKKAVFFLQLFTERWKQEEHKSRQGNDFANATQGLESLYLSCNREIQNCWRSWVSFLERSVRLENVLLQSQRNIPGLEKTYDEYIKALSRFRELTEQLPDDIGVISELTRLQEIMTDLKGEMQFDLPEDVSTFFKGLDNIDRNVSLSILTPNVLEWLQEKNMLDEYVVSRKSKY